MGLAFLPDLPVCRTRTCTPARSRDLSLQLFLLLLPPVSFSPSLYFTFIPWKDISLGEARDRRVIHVYTGDGSSPCQQQTSKRGSRFHPCVCALNELARGDTTFYCEYSTEKSSEHGFDFSCTPAGGCGANASAFLKLLALPPQR